MVHPFSVNERCSSFYKIYSPSLEALNAVLDISYNEQIEIVRQYFTEGIPYAFLGNPILYEKVRTWLAKQFDVNPKSITITGSARLGYTLNPYKTIGAPFSEKSDLDFIIVDSDLFERVICDFKLWAKDINQNRVVNKIGLSRKVDSDFNNILFISDSIKNGYIDQNKISRDRRYKTVFKMYDSFSHLILRMKSTANCPKPKDASVRIYKDWDSCIDRIRLNVHYSMKEYSKTNRKIEFPNAPLK